MPPNGRLPEPRPFQCRACGAAFMSRELGRRSWYCQGEACTAARERKRKAKQRRKVSAHRRGLVAFYRRWHPIVGSIDVESDGRPPHEQLALALRLLAGERAEGNVEGQREALRQIASRALAWEARL